MAVLTTGMANLLIVLAVGIAAGLAFNRYGQTWLRRQLATRHSDVTSSLVGVAGAFIGFHVGVILGLLPSPLMQYITAAICAVLVLWLWRGR
jgi:fucose permease